jgi:hypothetical protein
MACTGDRVSEGGLMRVNPLLFLAGIGALTLPLVLQRKDRRRVEEWFLIKVRRRNRLANAYMDHLLRGHKSALFRNSLEHLDHH